MKINYTIREARSNIFEVAVEDAYDLSMLFWRAQEFYESSNESFKGKKFSIWDYMKWYTSEKGTFSYPVDWEGFNLPLETARICYAWASDESPYDQIMREVIQDISDMKKEKKNDDPAYIIGFSTGDTKTHLHELCHGLYYTNWRYKKEMSQITDSIPKKIYNVLKNDLIKKGYNSEVIDDEIQAYMATEPYKYFPKVSKDVKKKLSSEYKKVLKKYK